MKFLRENIVKILLVFAQAQEGARRHHEGQHAVVTADEVEPEGGSGAQDLADEAEHGEREGEADAHADAVTSAREDAVLGGEGLRAAEDDAVHHDERDEQAQGLVHRRRISLHQQLEQRDEGGDDDDIDRDVHLVRHHGGDQGDDHVGKDQDEQRRQTHGQAVDGRRGGSQRRAHAQQQDEGRVVLDQTVGDEFEVLTHGFPPLTISPR